MPTNDLVSTDQAVNAPVDAERPYKGNGKDRTVRRGRRSGPILEPRNPRQWARELVARVYTKGSDRLIHDHRGQLHAFRAGRYVPFERKEDQNLAWDFLDGAKKVTGEGGDLAPFKPTSSDVHGLVDALPSICPLDSSLDPPFWIGNCCGLPPAKECLAVSNGVLHIPTGQLIPQTSRLFTLSASEVHYDPEAKCSYWDKFLKEVFGGDTAGEELLQDWSGYVLTQDTSFQKVLVMVGPKRGGKGTIANVLEGLVGEGGVTAPTIGHLSSSQHGKQCLIGKPLAIIGDARFGSSRNPDALAEFLLSISGGDRMNIPRKFLPDYIGRLPTRFMIVSNETPRFKDNSGTIVSRFLVLQLRKSFENRIDRTLFEKKLKPELSGILNWAIRGYKRLYDRDSFEQPKSANDAISRMEELASPLTAFVRARCILGEGLSVRTDQLYVQYQHWCEGYGHRATSHEVFGANLNAAYPEVGKSRPREDGKPTWHYTGIKLASVGYSEKEDE